MSVKSLPAVHVPRASSDPSRAVNVNVPRDATSPAPAEPTASAEEPLLDAEKLTVYHLALDLQELASTLVPAKQRVLHDQLERASLSIVLNIAEGAGRHSRRDKGRFYTIARGSATETAAVVDVLRRRRLAPEGACASARSLALRVVQMLTKLRAAL